jgi:hypothetical protein
MDAAAKLNDADQAADWAHKVLPLKNTLGPADARRVEDRFKERLAAIEASALDAGDPGIGPDSEAPGRRVTASTVEGYRAAPATAAAPEGAFATAQSTSVIGVNSGFEVATEAPAPALAPARRRSLAPKAIRLRDKEHCKFVARQPCVVCGRSPAEAHHLRFAQPRALGRKVSDEFTIPVCRTHHRELHVYGDEASWWAGVGVDPIPIALRLWRRSHAATEPDRSISAIEMETVAGRAACEARKTASDDDSAVSRIDGSGGMTPRSGVLDPAEVESAGPPPPVAEIDDQPISGPSPWA